MQIGKYNIRPVLLRIPDEQLYVDRYNACMERLAKNGIPNVYTVDGVHANKFGIIGTHPYELDNPNGGHMIGPKYVGSFLSQYVVYNVMLALPETHFMFLECDNVMNDNWREQLQLAMADIPEDFDFLFVGSCCAGDKRPKQVSGGSSVYKFPRTSGFPARYPMGGNCYIVAKKALPHIIATQRDAYAPADINLALHSFPSLDVYAILPRIAEQLGNENLPQ
jgi:hypothetical protein